MKSTSKASVKMVRANSHIHKQQRAFEITLNYCGDTHKRKLHNQNILKIRTTIPKVMRTIAR